MINTYSRYLIKLQPFFFEHRLLLKQKYEFSEFLSSKKTVIKKTNDPC